MKTLPVLLAAALTASVSCAAVGKLATTPTQLSELLNTVGPGDTIELASGDWPDIDLDLNHKGSAEAPITITGAGDGSTRLTGRSKIAIGGEYIVLSHLNFIGVEPPEGAEAIVSFRTNGDTFAAHCRLRQSVFDACNPADPERRYAWVRLYGSNNRVDHNLFRAQAHSGVTVQVMMKTPDAAHRIDHNHFLDRPQGDGNGFECIQIGQSQDSMKEGQCVVESNLFERCDGETEIISSKTCKNIIRDNVFFESAGTLTLRHGNDNLAEGNAFIGNGKADTGGIRVIGTGHIIRGNTFQGLTGRTGGVIVLYSGIPDSPLNGYFAAHGAVIEGNRFYDCQEPLIQERGGYGERGRSILPEGYQIRDNRTLDAPPADLDLRQQIQVGPGWSLAAPLFSP